MWRPGASIGHGEVSPDASNRRAIGWTLILGYIAYFLVQAGLAHIAKAEPWANVVEQWIWYSLAGAAMAIGCWIALGDGSCVVRSIAGMVGFVWIWIVWQSATYLACYDRQEQPGNTMEGFSYYAAGQAVFAIAVSIALLTSARWLLGIRLVRSVALGPLMPLRKRFTLAELFIVFAIFAFTFGTARAVAPRDTTYLTWFSMANENLNFLMGSTYIFVIAVPTAFIIGLYPRWTLLAALYYTAAVALVIVAERWSFVGRMGFSSWWFYVRLYWLAWLVYVIHVAAMLSILKWLGYRLEWNLRLRISLGEARAWR